MFWRTKLKRQASEWEISEESKGKIGKEEAKFIFEQAEKQLKQTIDVSAQVVTRTTILLTVCVAILTSAFGFVISNLTEGKVYRLLFWIAMLTLIYLTFVVILLVYNIRGHDYYDIGSEPAKLLHDHYMLTVTESEKRTAYYYISEAENYQKRITINKGINDRRWRRFHIALNLILIPIIIGAIVCFITTLTYVL